MNSEGEARPERVLVLAPAGRDAPMIRERLVAGGIDCEVCPDLPGLVEALEGGAGAAVIAQEALSPAGAAQLFGALEAQPAWSDLHVLLLSEARPKGPPRLPAGIFERTNVTLLQRPLGIRLFLSSVRSAVRARRRQYEMRDLYRELEAEVQLRETFVSILGHDLRTPLAAIRLSAGLLRRSSAAAGLDRPMDRIASSADRMSRMISQLLDLARVKQGQGIPLQVTATHLGELCRQVVQEVSAANPQANVEFRVCGDLAGQWDPDRLGQLVTNLADNAIRHGSPDAPVQVEVDGTAARAVYLRVRSRGTVPEALLPILFEPFKRRPSTQEPGRDGLGLGLFIASEISRAHGGDIRVRSVEDQTCFEVTLPRDSRPPAR